MTEKRFTLNLDSEWWFVNDNLIEVNEHGYRDDLSLEDIGRGLKQTLTEQETVDLLNSLSEENEQLKLQYKELEISLLNNQLAYNDLEKENEQLKKELDLFKPIIFESDGKPVTLYEKGGDVE